MPLPERVDKLIDTLPDAEKGSYIFRKQIRRCTVVPQSLFSGKASNNGQNSMFCPLF